jgi:hypothetical protein
MATCAWKDEACTFESDGNSKYCGPKGNNHRKLARLRFKDFVAEQAAVRAEKNDQFKAIFEEARQAGLAAGQAITPRPMIVTRDSMSIVTSSGQRPILDRDYVVPDGPCGFAWVVIRPGNSPAANYAKKNLNAHKHYYGGMEIWVSDFGQSMARKEAYAEAYAEVLRKHGIQASAGSRMD